MSTQKVIDKLEELCNLAKIIQENHSNHAPYEEVESQLDELVLLINALLLEEKGE